MSLIVVLFIFLTAVNVPSFADCVCVPAKDADTTHWVGNMAEVRIERERYQELKGRVVVSGSGKALGGALVEVFTRPEYLLSNETYSRGTPEQLRVAACVTGPDGKFCFRKLPAGAYELRSSSSDTYAGWNASQVYVVVDHEKGKYKDLRVTMTLGN